MELERTVATTRLQRLTWWMLGASFLAWPFWAFELGHSGETGFTAMALFGILALVAFALRILFSRPIALSIHRHAGWMLVLVLAIGVSFVSLIWDGAPTIDKPARATTHLFFELGLAAAWATLDMPPTAVLRLFRWWIWISVPICIFGIFQIFARAFDLPLAWLDMTNVTLWRGAQGGEYQQLSLRFGNFYRATSVFSEPGTLGFFCVQALVMLGAAAVAHRGHLLIASRAVRTCVIMLLLLTILVTFSLGAFITTLVFAALLIGSFDRARRWRIARGIALGVAVAVVFDLVVLAPALDTSVIQLMSDRVRGIVAASNSGDSREYISGESFSARWRTIESGAGVWVRYPLIGAGFGRYGEVSGTHAYNDTFYLRVLSELGLAGLALMLGFMGTLMWKLRELMRRVPVGEPAWIAARALAYMMALQLVLGWMTDFMLFELFWMQVGMALLVLKAGAAAAHETVLVVP